MQKGKGTGVIYAIEEPETSQHPNNQKILIKAFEELAEQPGAKFFSQPIRQCWLGDLYKPPCATSTQGWPDGHSRRSCG